MLFNSLSFIFIFLPLSLMGYYWVLKHQPDSARYSFLIIASLVFYGYWDIRFVPLLIASIFINYLIAGCLIRSGSKTTLVAGISFNIVLIAYFKYAGFLTTNLAAAGFSVPVLEIILPLGISFFTFQQIAYLVDAKQGIVKDQNPFEYSLFVLFFPQLIAGPIVHHKEMIPQFRQQQPNTEFWSSPLVAHGLVLLIVGLFKKVVIADTLALYVDPVFSDVSSATFLEVWTAAIGYTLQLYFDFCGYCEVAMGIALLFGIRLPINFNSPYKASSIIEFWQRWHITLGRFLKQYLYIPLGGNRHGKSRLVLALILTMFLGGLWHGAGWTFVVWGLLQGGYLAINHLWRTTQWKLPPKLAWWVTFIAIVISWVVFRSNSLSDAGLLIIKMSGIDGLQLTPLYHILLGSRFPTITTAHSSLVSGFEIMFMGLIMLFLTRTKNIHEWTETFKPSVQKQISLAIMAGAVLLSINNPSVFLYFQF